MDKQFIKVGDAVFQIANITLVTLNGVDVQDCITISTASDTEDGGRIFPIEMPETQAFIAWLTSSERCIDVMAPEPEIDEPLALDLSDEATGRETQAQLLARLERE